MQNYRYRSSGSSRGCIKQPDTRQGNMSNDEQSLEYLPVAMAYVPWSSWKNIYEVEKGFRRGTIFQNLDKPFRGIGGCQNVR